MITIHTILTSSPQTNMNTQLKNYLQDVKLPPELERVLDSLFDETERVLPKLPGRRSRVIAALLARLPGEVIDETVGVHWWELALDLTQKWAPECSKDGEKAVAAALRAREALRQYMRPYQPVRLVEITEETVRGICLLSETLSDPRRSMVADNAISLAQAHFSQHAWFRAVYAGKAPVGFLMLYDDAQEPEYFLWRFMIGGPFQGRGYGRQAIQQLEEYVRSRPGAKTLDVSCGEGEGSPLEFYVKMGFVPTGDKIEDEIVLKKSLL
jgi:diamine N-acetyltransferase